MIKENFTGGHGVERVIAPASNVFTGVNARPTLAHENVSSQN
jgi:hypothetical protein